MDICKCSGIGCPKKQSCYRYTAKASDYQSFFMTPPVKDNECTYYWDNKERKDGK